MTVADRGLSCVHGYPPGECCPACGEVPADSYFWGDEDDHGPDCYCFDCDEGDEP